MSSYVYLVYKYIIISLRRPCPPSFLVKLNSFIPFVSFTDVVYIHHTKRTMATVCQICDYKMNLTTRKPVSCPYCNFETCRTCVETYVLGDTTIKCMSPQCNRQWTRQHIHSIFTATFIRGRLKSHREQLLFDNERALLPSTQPLVERDIRLDEITRERNTLTNQIGRIYQQRVDLDHEWRRLSNTEVARVAEFVRECPAPECRGFLSTQWKCGICNLWTCPDCHEIKGDSRDVEHTCDPNTLATARLLDSDTKPCPKCRTGIFKINGCDQMWCTQCHTAFNWRTGRIESVVHNPHYFEWLRRNGNAIPRNPGDIPCQNELTHTIYTDIRNRIRDYFPPHPLREHCDTYLNRTIRNILHMRYVTLNEYDIPNRAAINERLRVQYMRNRISEEYFKVTLQRTDKRIEKKRETRDIITLLLTTSTDIILRFYNKLRDETNPELDGKIVDELKPIVDYANECLREIGRVYTGKTIQYSYEFSIQ